jgi:hypothetical protein
MFHDWGVRVEQRDGVWALSGAAAGGFGLVNEYRGAESGRAQVQAQVFAADASGVRP